MQLLHSLIHSGYFYGASLSLIGLLGLLRGAPDYSKSHSSRHVKTLGKSFTHSACGLRLDDGAVRIAPGPRLGVGPCVQHECPCGALVTADGSHGLSCRLGRGRTAKRALINDITWRDQLKAGFQATREPVGLVRSNGKHPDGVALIPWEGGRCLA